MRDKLEQLENFDAATLMAKVAQANLKTNAVTLRPDSDR